MKFKAYYSDKTTGEVSTRTFWVDTLPIAIKRAKRWTKKGFKFIEVKEDKQ